MIPWETFKTPQDAYEWAKKHFGKGLYRVYLTPPESAQGDRFFALYLDEGINLPVRR